MKYRVNFINSNYRRFYQAHKREVDSAVQNCLAKGELTLRKDLWDLEKSIADYVGTKYAAGVGSGTDALFLSLKALGIGPGDEVVTVSNTFIATIQAIVHCGASPLLVDVNEDEQMDPEELERAITKKTKAIVPVHYTGAMCDMREILRIARKHKIHVVEDACQALGAEQGGKRAGSFGITGCLSFNNAKLLGGLCDGGMVVTNDRKLYERICLLRNHWNVHQLSVDRNDYPQPKRMEWAWKSRLSNVNAAFLNVKFKYLDWMIKRRSEIANRYTNEFCCKENIISDLTRKKRYLVPHDDFVQERIWQEYHFRALKDRGKLADFLKKNGIETLTRDTVPNHKMRGLGLGGFSLPVTESLAKEVIRLPLHEWLTDKEVEWIIGAVKRFYAKR